MLTYTGFIKVKGNEQKVSDRFRKREFVLTDNSPSYPQTILFQLTQDRCSLIENSNVGDEITVHFQLKGREWRNPQGEIKFFNSLDVFKIEKAASAPSAGNISEPNFTNETLVPTPDDDLPF
ncbi:MAG: DUF3127 domain-containing protein [Bacteroidetes bacterium]|nr:DUF3127 domain-containing protein [Bacteroidota bacterium]